jgi:magnesium transporter
VFLFANRIITIHRNEIPFVNELFQLHKVDETARNDYLGRGSDFLLAILLQKLFERNTPMVDHLVTEIEILRDRIFAKDGKNLIEEILTIQRNIIDFQRIFEPQRAIITTLVGTKEFADSKLTRPHTQNIIDSIAEISELLNAHKDMIEVIRTAHESLNSHRFTKTVKILTVYSLLTGPINFVLYILPWKLGGLERYTGTYMFIITVITFIAVIIGIIAYFRYRRWY